MIEYGREWPDGTTMANIHLWCYRNHKNNSEMLEKHKHFEYAIKCLWPEKMSNGVKGFIWDDWAYRRIKSFCNREYQTWWGPSSSGKSTCCGVFALSHWLSAPDKTTVVVCSTTKDMLERRIWREILRFHSMYGNKLPGYHSKTKHAIIYEDPESKAAVNTINAIFAIAVQRGTTAEAVGNMVGMHNDYNVLIIDEMQATKQAAVEAYDNLSTGLESKFVGMGNPVSRLDPLGRASLPVNGWGTVSVSDKEWKTKRGWCLFFNGLESPGVEDPKKYHYLLTQKQIDAMSVDPGRDSPRFWSQRIGFVAPEGLTQTIFSENFMSKFSVTEKALWAGQKKRISALDPSFSAGGDRCVYRSADYGKMTNGKIGFRFNDPELINLEVSTGEPMSYDLAFKVMDKLESDGITPSELCIDTTSAQKMVADIIDREWAVRQAKKTGGEPSIDDVCVRCSFGGAASDLPVSVQNKDTGKDLYKNKVTELWYVFREFAVNDQIRDLDEDTVEEFCIRTVLEKMDSSGRIVVESKKDMKLRGNASPDLADAAVLIVEYARRVLHIMAGSGSAMLEQGFGISDANKNDVWASDDLYPEEKTLCKNNI